MTISPVTATTPSASSPATGQGTSKISSDFTTFLKMLTVQMQNQDPLNPIDSSDYAVQLATFSGVEQQVQTNQLLAEMAGRFAQLGMSEMAGWIGQEARSSAAVWYDGSAVSLSPNPAVGSTRAVIVVKDAQGNLVSREEIPPTAEPYQWLGADVTGEPLPEGRYQIALESWKGEQLIDTRAVEHYARVIEARGGSDGTRLVLEGGIEVAASAVTGLRLPQ
ncbi:MAG: flagellar hook capping FlgD N-terminal domain-containing protein [Tabrizicola sp.]|uniref:flagellar hook capping FlgD N-terminal domain-containing protein n=1 Tax=Tabrizicola sp. TaxID=2005166 RepID=UPI002733E487|nr:flagellar hook capping FlgD N-terminal domain-containing protein [Tabrizicola sp.]MDP3262469.1 flagellar hook capping FlgD N-terminal domain-containing protein [Tabrizicola sp.]MDP3648511.1 flagellar hook capping FlgD N-terminal domain-containing protein [Paracoccaceae bacterium]MDZ4066038.1 flagellar hook capping FlgD N-terminal domain-containing protein [Tabrizicola sp.]